MGFEKPESGLPDKSVITEEMYREMYRVASKEDAMNVLEKVDTKGTVDYEDADSRFYEKLNEAGLLEKRASSDRVYYSVTSLGEVILKNGPTEGVKELMRREEEFEEEYSSDN